MTVGGADDDNGSDADSRRGPENNASQSAGQDDGLNRLPEPKGRRLGRSPPNAGVGIGTGTTGRPPDAQSAAYESSAIPLMQVVMGR